MERFLYLILRYTITENDTKNWKENQKVGFTCKLKNKEKSVLLAPR